MRSLGRFLPAILALVALALTTVSFVHRVGGGVHRIRPPRVAAGYGVFAKAMAIPDTQVGVPVLTYHAIADDDRPYTVSPADFAQQLAMLQAAGFHSVRSLKLRPSTRPSARAPSRPILLTFDDGVGSVWTTADPILARYGFKAAMFVITSRVAARPPSYYLTWSQLRAMRDSGRWEIGSHSHNQHLMAATGNGTRGPAMNNRILLSNGRPESIGHWQNRVTDDLDLSRHLLRKHLGVSARTFAYPFSATSDSSDDPRDRDRTGRSRRKPIHHCVRQRR